MEHEIYISGIGGQGIQLVAKVLALAAMSERRQVMLNGFYGFEMRGGISLSTLVIGDHALKALPVAAEVGAAIALHHNFWEKPMSRLRKGAFVMADAAIADQLPAMPDQTVMVVDATRIAKETGNPMVLGMALMAAFNAATGLVRAESLIAAMKDVVPAYRRQHVVTNERAIELGTAAVSPLCHRLPLGSGDGSLEHAA